MWNISFILTSMLLHHLNLINHFYLSIGHLRMTLWWSKLKNPSWFKTILKHLLSLTKLTGTMISSKGCCSNAYIRNRTQKKWQSCSPSLATDKWKRKIWSDPRSIMESGPIGERQFRGIAGPWGPIGRRVDACSRLHQFIFLAPDATFWFSSLFYRSITTSS